MKTSIFSIRNTLFGILAIMVLMVLSFSVLNSIAAYGTLQNGQRVEALTKTADLLLASGNNWAVERGATNAALNRAEAVADPARAVIDKRRATADAAFTEAVAALRADGFPASGLTEAEKNFADIAALRKQVDSELAKPKAQRDTAIVRGWVPNITNLIIASQDIRGQLFEGIDLDGEATQLVSLKHFAWLMSEYAGRERAVMGGIIGGGKPVTSEKLSLLSGFRGRVEAAWKIIQGAASDENMSGDVKSSVRTAATNYFGEFQEMRLQVYAAGTGSALYPVDGSAWINQATNGINSLLAVNTAVAKAWAAYGVEVDADAFSNHMITSTSNWAVERGATNSALKADGAVSAKVRAVIDQRRKAGDAGYAATMTMIKSWPEFAGKSAAVAALSDGHAKLRQLRTRVDAALGQSSSGRDAAVVQDWVPTVSNAIQKVVDLCLVATLASGQRDAMAGKFLRMKHAGWTMSEYAGRERAVMGGVIASAKPLTPAQLTALSTFRGRVLTAWELVSRAVNANPELSGVAAAFAEAKKVYFGNFNNLRKSVYAASSGTATYPLSGGDWIQRSTAAIDTLLAIQAAVSGAAHQQAGDSVAAAFTNLIVNLMVLLAGVLIAVVATVVIAKRVVGSIAAITREMTALAEGDLTIEISGAGRADEIGHMAGAVEGFKTNALERERLEAEAKEAEIRSEQEKKQ
ncbi:MAG: HAMP domain-containing protein, partial [Rhodospirillaceae bacterium]|nr:HAMP domain-containing protein [Rhodospirillaceae bacterium]